MSKEEHSTFQDFEEGPTEDDAEPFDFWVKKQREVQIQQVDYSLKALSELVGDKTIDLSPKYQRRNRWDHEKKSKLIESFLMNVPVPPIFLNEDEFGDYSVIDGKQRLLSISEFFNGTLVLKGLDVFEDINGMTFLQLPPKFKRVIQTRPILRTTIVLRQSDEDVKFEVFKRLNTGGVSLNDQEIRNATYTGPLNDLILELSENPKFHKLLGIANLEKSAMWEQMRDVEFVLRYFTFRDTWQKFTGGMALNMDRFMADNRRINDSELELLRKEFFDILDVVEVCFGEHAFRRWLPEEKKWKQWLILASLYDAQMFGCMEVSLKKAKAKKTQILNGMKKLFDEEEFQKHISGATNTASYFKGRVQRVREMIANILR